MQDRARIHIEAGAGGDGCLSFRREAHVPKGGPDGGDGGRGGDVLLVCDDSLRDLATFRRKPNYAARKGGNGEGGLRHGADGDPLVLRVPPGTEALVERDGTRHDLVIPGQRVPVARVRRDSSDDLPALGRPIRPTSASSLSCSASHDSSPRSPRSANRGV
jgi:GTP-binding protein